jgi:hypothetical protein
MQLLVVLNMRMVVLMRADTHRSLDVVDQITMWEAPERDPSGAFLRSFSACGLQVLLLGSRLLRQHLGANRAASASPGSAEAARWNCRTVSGGAG